MNFEFKYSLSEEDVTKLTAWYNSLEHVSIEQHPLWRNSTEAGTYCYFIGSHNDIITCSAVISENRKMRISYAAVDFGPLFSNNETLIESIQAIFDYYRRKGFTALSVQPGWPISNDSEYIEYRISKILPLQHLFDRNNWSSIVVDLSQDEERLVRNLSKGHKSDIKKAKKSGLTVTDTFDEKDFDDFTAIYTKMHRQRGLAENDQGSAVYLKKIRLFFQSQNSGTFFLVKDGNGEVLGGIVIVFQNKTVRYLKGAADPEIRNLPILHLAIWEAIVKSKNEGFAFFDLWGYNHFVDEKDQVFFINRFKKGFGGHFTFYPKKMYFIYKPLRHRLFTFTRMLYKKLKKR